MGDLCQPAEHCCAALRSFALDHSAPSQLNQTSLTRCTCRRRRRPGWQRGAGGAGGSGPFAQEAPAHCGALRPAVQRGRCCATAQCVSVCCCFQHAATLPSLHSRPWLRVQRRGAQRPLTCRCGERVRVWQGESGWRAAMLSCSCLWRAWPLLPSRPCCYCCQSAGRCWRQLCRRRGLHPWRRWRRRRCGDPRGSGSRDAPSCMSTSLPVPRPCMPPQPCPMSPPCCSGDPRDPPHMLQPHVAAPPPRCSWRSVARRRPTP